MTRLGIVTEAFAERPLAAGLDWLGGGGPQVQGPGVGPGGGWRAGGGAWRRSGGVRTERRGGGGGARCGAAPPPSPRREHPDLLVCIELHPGTLVYNVETFERVAALGDNLAANLDPSHF